MGNFVHHLSGGVIAGAAVGYTARTYAHLPTVDAAAIGLVCTIASLLPDIDSQESRPNQLLFQALSAIAPIIVVQQFAPQLRWSTLLLFAAIAYVFVGWGLKVAFAKLTIHRGIFHSIPMAIVTGAITFLLASPLPSLERHWLAAAATLGYAVHLVIDELFAFVNFEGTRLSPKQSFGTALKFGAPSVMATIATYLVLGLLLYECWRTDPFAAPFLSLLP